MKDKYQSAAQKLHNFICDDADLSDAEIVECLKAEGVDIEHFLDRLGQASGMSVKQPTTSERLRALASRAGSRMKTLFSTDNAVVPYPEAMAYGRQGKTKEAGKDRPSSPKRTKR